MSLQAIYESFLGDPKAASLVETASLNYITTLTTIHHAEPIATHLQTQNKSVVKKKVEKVIGAVEGHSSLSLDVETTLEFISGGGAYLPRLENFVVDKIATLPTVSQQGLNSRVTHMCIYSSLITSKTCYFLLTTPYRFTRSNSIKTERSRASVSAGTKEHS